MHSSMFMYEKRLKKTCTHRAHSTENCVHRAPSALLILDTALTSYKSWWGGGGGSVGGRVDYWNQLSTKTLKKSTSIQTFYVLITTFRVNF